MELSLEKLIESKIDELVKYITEQNASIDEDVLYHKINKLIKPLPLKKSKPKNGALYQNIITKIQNNKPVIKVVKSDFSNYILKAEDTNFDDISSSKFVMDLSTKTIIGFENSIGEIEPLNKDLIDICNKYKLRYNLPLNLNLKDEYDEDKVIIEEMEELGLHFADSEDEIDDE